MNESLKLGCVIMASGLARRFGSNKLLQSFRGKPLIHYAFESIPADRFSDMTVVTQYPEIAQAANEAGFRVLNNSHADEGISASVRLGTAALSGCDGILFLVGDQPLLKKSSVSAMVEAYRKDPEKIISASYSGKRRNPCIFPKRCFAELLGITGDNGGSVVIRQHPELLVLFELPPEELADIDTVEELQRREAFD